MNEFWSKSKEKDITVTGIQTYKKTTKDFRTPVERILGVRYRRERQEELELMDQVYSAKGQTSIRRVQKLTPIVDFDWIFLPAYPNEAIQLIPSFSYFDAMKVSFIGGPSWYSTGFMKRIHRMGRVHTIGNEFSFSDAEIKEYQTVNKFSPGIVEVLSLDAVSILRLLLANKAFTNRIDLEKYLAEIGVLAGKYATWRLEDKLWIKDMNALRLKRSRAVKVELFEKEEKVIEQVQSI